MSKSWEIMEIYKQKSAEIQSVQSVFDRSCLMVSVQAEVIKKLDALCIEYEEQILDLRETVAKCLN